MVTVFLSTKDLFVAPSASGECGNNRPERRKRVIYEVLSSASRADRVTFEDVTTALDINKDTTCGVHEDSLLTVFRDGWKLFVELTERVGKIPADFSIPSNSGGGHSEAGTESVHDVMLVAAQWAPRDALQRPGRSILSLMTYHAQDRFTPICTGTADMLASDLAVVHTAVDALV